MTKKKQVGLIATLIAVAVITTASMAFAFWNVGYKGNTQSLSAKDQVKISEGQVTDTKLTLTDMGLSPAGKLIPSNITPANGEVQQITFKVNVSWASVAGGSIKGVTAPLDIKLSDITDGTASLSPADQALFSLSYGPPKVTGDSANGEEVYIVIKMTEPADKAQYERVVNKNLAFTFSFSVSDNV